MTAVPDSPRRRGRPRAGADPQGPLDEWIDGLSPTAIHIVEAGRRVLVEDGYEAVTIERVAHEANVSPPTVRRLFVSKAGLLHAIFSRLEAEAWEKLVAEVKDIEPPAARLEAYVRGLGRLIDNARRRVGLTEALAHGVRDPILRDKFAVDYDLARRGWLELAELDEAAAATAARPGPATGPSDRRRALASLIVATIDGLSLQVAADPDAVDLDATFAVLAEMVRDWLLRRPAGGLDRRLAARRRLSISPSSHRRAAEPRAPYRRACAQAGRRPSPEAGPSTDDSATYMRIVGRDAVIERDLQRVGAELQQAGCRSRGRPATLDPRALRMRSSSRRPRRTALTMPSRALRVERRPGSRQRDPARSRLIQDRQRLRVQRLVQDERAAPRWHRATTSPARAHDSSSLTSRISSRGRTLRAAGRSRSAMLVEGVERRPASCAGVSRATAACFEEPDDLGRERSVVFLRQRLEPVVELVGHVAHVQRSHAGPPFLHNVPRRGCSLQHTG